jgi:hypothetical protein
LTPLLAAALALVDANGSISLVADEKGSVDFCSGVLPTLRKLFSIDFFVVSEVFL